VDLAFIDLLQGIVDFIKIGSAPSFIKRGSQVSMVRANSLPIGILNNIDVDTIQQVIGHDDVLVMLSDGLLETVGENHDESWIMDTLQNIVTTDPQNIADLLLNRAILNSGGSVTDDMTVIVTRIVSANRC
ncbi:MAG TPA: SpoIIE family protein phosphatase, partial [Desulfobacteria bacterium]|nr:SpoIIE family protein phosphatase [Desulfobacteria bacterium]